ncbi:MAG: ribonuclease R, partial [Bacteroidota bacterium]
VYPKANGRRPEGEVVQLLERKREEFVGKIELSERYAFVIADNKKMHLDIFVPHNLVNKAKNGDKVIVKIKQWHDAKNSPVGEVTRVLGKAGEHNTEMHAILAEFDLPLQFPREVLDESNKIRSRVTKAEISKRRDFRKVSTFTIDPADAKDFDDALSIQPTGEDRWEIGIHIADVTHYVRPNTALEQEAEKRATSVYLVDRVIPMLPEKLSNDLCSLRPHEDRLTFSAVFELNKDGEVLSEWYGRTVIYSDRRFAYEEAQEVMETGQGDYAEELQLLNHIAKRLNARRFEKGAVNFDTTEVKFKLDEAGKPIGIFIKERKDAHKLIEEFMLLANRKVAEFVYKKRDSGKERAMVYRVHEKPDAEKLQNFSLFAKKYGHEIALNGKAIATSINALVEKTRQTPQQDVLQHLAIRTMAKARYSTEALGHFGLAFEHYTHFTSPIRRYPDMMVHRLLQRYLDEKRSVNKEEYEQKSRSSTDMEKRAADAERASIKYKQVEYMQYMEDIEYEGVVTGVTEWGVYVEISLTKCEGMVRMSDIVDDFYELDSENYRVVGKKSKKVIAFGDSVKVRIKDTNLEKRTLDLIFV